MAELWSLGRLVLELQKRNGFNQMELDNTTVNAQRIMRRGDSLVVYEDQDLGSIYMGQLFVTSYGSADAQIERTQFPEIPDQLPDIGGYVNWRFRLIAEVWP